MAAAPKASSVISTVLSPSPFRRIGAAPADDRCWSPQRIFIGSLEHVNTCTGLSARNPERSVRPIGPVRGRDRLGRRLEAAECVRRYRRRPAGAGRRLTVCHRAGPGPPAVREQGDGERLLTSARGQAARG
ncbi:hypothetical protein GCM10010327_41130 [Streptomyces nitrosporeus]|nr:hypothetical protein GCM10010327_41130 [Streptomyces nitrosporeus]